jgi:hypothetical protein
MQDSLGEEFQELRNANSVVFHGKQDHTRLFFDEQGIHADFEGHHSGRAR